MNGTPPQHTMESLQLEPDLPPVDGGRAAWSYLVAATCLEASAVCVY